MRRTGGLVLAAALLLAACGGDDGESSTTPITDPVGATSSAEEPSTTSTTEDPEAAIEQAYYDQWDAFVEILSDPDPANPLIDKHFTGVARETVLAAVSRFVREGHAARKPADRNDFKPAIQRIQLLSSNEALVFECTIDGIVVYDRASGRAVNDSVDLVHNRNLFVFDEGAWRISSTRDVEPSDGAPPCVG